MDTAIPEPIENATSVSAVLVLIFNSEKLTAVMTETGSTVKGAFCI
jgi:hypothetical protein